ncbi:MAG: phage tail protein [Chloroflexi bacterium]|nr:phage tail protein [Chloroflexota bacterium]
MSIGTRKDPVRAYNFTVTLIDSTTALSTIAVAIGVEPQAGFSECSGLEMVMTPEEYRQGGENQAVRKFPSRITWANLRLKRGVAYSNDLWEWCTGFVEGRGKRRDGIISLRDDEQTAVRVWKFTRGIPVKWSGPALNAMQGQIAFEELEIAHEGLKLVSSVGGKLVEAVANIVTALQ